MNAITLHDVQNAIKAINPRLSVNHNGSGLPIWSDWDFCARDDYVTHEFHYNEGHGHLGLLCRKLRALKPDTPFEVEIWRFFNRLNDTLRGYQIRPLPMHLVEMATVLAHGGFVQYYDQINPDGTLDGRSLDVMQAAFEQVKRWEPWVQPALGHRALVFCRMPLRAGGDAAGALRPWRWWPGGDLPHLALRRARQPAPELRAGRFVGR